jgi:hypothetical protein
MQHFESGDVTTYVTRIISDTASKNGGIYPVFDPVSGQHLKLTFDHVDFVRTLAGYGYFPGVAFSSQDDPAKKYVHKVAEKQRDGSYIQVPRYNFDDLKFDVVP